MRILKSLLIALIGVTALLYALQNIANIDGMREQVRHAMAANDYGGASLALSWAAFALITMCQLTIAGVALKGGWDLFAARNGTPDHYKAAKTAAVWAGGLSLLLWFLLVLMVGGGLFEWGYENGHAAMTKAFALGSTSALTVLFVWGTTD